MKKEKVVTFKEKIYIMCMKYAIIPAFAVALAGVILTFSLWWYTTINVTKSSNEMIKKEIDYVLQNYEEELNYLSNQLKLEKFPIEKQKQANILERSYRLYNHLGYRAKLYIFDESYQDVLKNTKELPSELQGKEVANWGIFRQLNQTPSTVVVKIIPSTEDKNSCIYIGKTIENGTERKGYVIFEIDSKQFQVLLTKVPVQTVITDRFGWVYIGNNYDFCDNLNRISRQYATQIGYTKKNGKNFYIEKIANTGEQFTIYSILDISNQLSVFRWVWILIALLFGGIFICFMKGAEKISVYSTKDIDIIVKAFEQVKKGKLDEYISIASSREFQIIGEAYNLMIDSLRQHIEKNKEMISHMAFAQIKQLESQMNPHFLFNTLENIRIMCKIDIGKADKMIVDLSALLRYSISNGEKEITVKRDMEIMQHYLNILKIRFNQHFQYAIEIEPEIEQMIIPKLLIQPLIENSIKYGFGDKEKLKVEIRGYRQKNDLIFYCQDDGIGIDEDTLCELRKILAQPKNRSTHLGLYNIHKRIQLQYQGDYGMTIDSIKNQGTKVTLRLPIYKKENEIC